MIATLDEPAVSKAVEEGQELRNLWASSERHQRRQHLRLIKAEE